MEKLLFLCHRIPYPPNKGDKIRSFHFLKGLAKRYQVYLAAFVDDPDDWRYQSALSEYTAECRLFALNPRLAKIKSLSGLLAGQPLSLPYYKNNACRHWVEETVLREGIDRVLVFSSVMGQFIEDLNINHKVSDLVDVDSDKWAQYAVSKTWPMSWLYRREAKTLLGYERKLASASSSVVLVSGQEAGLFSELAPESADKITFVSNGVDTDFFSPEKGYASPYQPRERALVFTGAMDYWANIDAVTWFANQVFPQLQRRFDDVKFYIVGSKPGREVQALQERPGIVVTGRVEDVRPYLAHAVAAVAPLRIARGIQNKVLEAMAMTKPVIATAAAIEGIPVTDRLAVSVNDSAEGQIETISRWLTDRVPSASVNRDFVLAEFSWRHSLDKLNDLIEQAHH